MRRKTIRFKRQLTLVIIAFFLSFFIPTPPTVKTGKRSLIPLAFARSTMSLPPTPSPASPPTSPPTITPTLTPTSTPKPVTATKRTQSVTIQLPNPPPVNNQPQNNFSHLFSRYAQEYNVDERLLTRIARCESGFNPHAVGSGIYGGLFQFHANTWVGERNRLGLNTDSNLRFNAEEAIKTAASKISRDGVSAWPVCGYR